MAPLRSWPWGILAVALAVRLGLLLASPGYVPFADAGDYDLIARSLVDFGRGTPSYFAEWGSASALRPPAYPYLLAGVYEVFGKSLTAGRILGALLGTVTVLLVWAVVRRLWDARLARWAAAVAALAPTLAWMSAGLVAETLYIPLLLGAVLLVIVHRATPSWRWALLAGLVLGVSVMTRNNGLVVAIPLLAAAYMARRSWRDPAVLVAGLIVALVPWTVRNAVVLDTFAPLGTQSGITLVGNFNETSLKRGPRLGAWHTPDQIPSLLPYIHRPGTTEPELDAFFRRRALGFAWDHPRYTAAMTVRHGLQLLELAHTTETSANSYREQGVPRGIARSTGRIGLYGLLVLAAAAVALVARRRRWRLRLDLIWFWAIPVLLFVTVAPLLGPPRYRLPIDPFLCVLAAMALMAGWDRARSRRAAEL